MLEIVIISVITSRLSKNISCNFYQWFSIFEKLSVISYQGDKYYNILSVIPKSVIIFLNFISLVFISDYIILKNISFHCYQWIPRVQNISVIGYQWWHFLKIYQLCISVHWYKNGPLIKKNLWWNWFKLTLVEELFVGKKVKQVQS